MAGWGVGVSLSCHCGLILESWSTEVGTSLTGLRSRCRQGYAPSGALRQHPFPAFSSFWGPLTFRSSKLQSLQHGSNPSYLCLSALLVGLPHPPLRVLVFVLGPPGSSRRLPVLEHQQIDVPCATLIPHHIQ